MPRLMVAAAMAVVDMEAAAELAVAAAVTLQPTSAVADGAAACTLAGEVVGRDSVPLAVAVRDLAAGGPHRPAPSRGRIRAAMLRARMFAAATARSRAATAEIMPPTEPHGSTPIGRDAMQRTMRG
jgi:hypothetical protein